MELADHHVALLVPLELARPRDRHRRPLGRADAEGVDDHPLLLQPGDLGVEAAAEVLAVGEEHQHAVLLAPLAEQVAAPSRPPAPARFPGWAASPARSASSSRSITAGVEGERGERHAAPLGLHQPHPVARHRRGPSAAPAPWRRTGARERRRGAPIESEESTRKTTSTPLRSTFCSPLPQRGRARASEAPSTARASAATESVSRRGAKAGEQAVPQAAGRPGRVRRQAPAPEPHRRRRRPAGASRASQRRSGSRRRSWLGRHLQAGGGRAGGGARRAPPRPAAGTPRGSGRSASPCSGVFSSRSISWKIRRSPSRSVAR